MRCYMKKTISIEEYQEINIKTIEFPKKIYVAYAVCRRDCGSSEFIKGGATQICKHCGHQMFRTEERIYTLVDDSYCKVNNCAQKSSSNEVIKISDYFKLEDYPDVAPNSVEFPTEICIVYAVCRKECGNREFLIDSQTDICEYCGHHMLHTVGRKYILTKDET